MEWPLKDRTGENPDSSTFLEMTPKSEQSGQHLLMMATLKVERRDDITLE